jgi:hypothetical protein
MTRLSPYQHVCQPHDLTYGRDEVFCGQCGRTWTLTTNKEGGLGWRVEPLVKLMPGGSGTDRRRHS